ncbi:hypothetical protein P43SY_004791 [Pythium insidiosum]|uniref:UDP-galactose transporter n=1 Tax=Pythium insidiosum TaxID=114742 RepID=A0AAD5Q9R2_PYTIN|nr:hypothetical protein P43SY_004791 [Pythium insidiosum]
MDASMDRLRAFFTPLVVKKLTLLTLLSVQIGFQPLLMGWYAKEARNVGLRVGVIEAMKLLMGVIPLLVTGEFAPQLKNWNVHTALQTTAAPALIYVLQNYLNQAAVVVLDGVTFNILNQTKIIWTALLVYLMLRRYQSRQQIVALTILCGAAVLMTTGKSSEKKSSAAASPGSDGADAAFFTGAYQALIAAILSALAGTIIQRALQSQKRNAYVVTIELSILGELTIFLWTVTTTDNGFFAKPKDPTAHTNAPSGESLWAGWTIMTVFTLFCQAAGGVLVGFVIKHCGNVEKSFAVVAGMIITALLETQYNNKPFGMRGVIAVLMVATATIMYTLYPPQQPMAVAPDAKGDGKSVRRGETAPTYRFYNKDTTVAAGVLPTTVELASAGRAKKNSAASEELEPFLDSSASSPTSLQRISVVDARLTRTNTSGLAAADSSVTTATASAANKDIVAVV